MPKFSTNSKAILATCHPHLQSLCNLVIVHYDFKVLWGHREERVQNEFYREKRSKKKFPCSKHNFNPSLAVDIAPYPIDWNDIRRFDILAGRIMECADEISINIRWGGDWDSDDDVNDQTFNDLGHFELM